MKVWVELDGDDELHAFLRWRRIAARAAEDEMARKAVDDKHGRTNIAGLGWPPALMTIIRRAGVETVQQAREMTDEEWIKTPLCGRKSLTLLRQLLAALEAP